MTRSVGMYYIVEGTKQSLKGQKMMTEYEAKQEAKKERYLELAGKAQQRSTAAYGRSRQIGGVIPFGQPILVGHHSERKHRADIKRMDNLMMQCVENDKKAEYYQQKADGVGKAGISGDDPEAITKLKKQIEEHKEAQKMSASSNRGAKIRRIKKRIELLEKRPTVTKRYDIGNDIIMIENREENRLQFIFPSKPDTETRKLLKSNGLKWSPRNNAWQRKITGNAIFAARSVIKKLKTIKS